MTLCLSFVDWTNNGNVVIYGEIPKHIQTKIIKSMELSGDSSEYIVSFPRYTSYHTERSRKLIDYTFKVLPANIKQVVTTNDQYTYELKKIDSFIEKCTLHDLIFICGISNKMNLPEYLVSIVNYMTEKFGVTLNQMISICESEVWIMKVFVKKNEDKNTQSTDKNEGQESI